MRHAKGVEVNEAEGKILEQMTRETKSRAGLGAFHFGAKRR